MRRVVSNSRTFNIDSNNYLTRRIRDLDLRRLSRALLLEDAASVEARERFEKQRSRPSIEAKPSAVTTRSLCKTVLSTLAHRFARNNGQLTSEQLAAAP